MIFISVYRRIEVLNWLYLNDKDQLLFYGGVKQILMHSFKSISKDDKRSYRCWIIIYHYRYACITMRESRNCRASVTKKLRNLALCHVYPFFLFSFNEGFVPAAFIMFYSSFNCIKKNPRFILYYKFIHIFNYFVIRINYFLRIKLILNPDSNFFFFLDFREKRS